MSVRVWELYHGNDDTSYLVQAETKLGAINIWLSERAEAGFTIDDGDIVPSEIQVSELVFTKGVHVRD